MNSFVDDEANKFCGGGHDLYEAALLAGCCARRALRPCIDSEINHIGHFIKIPFINKGIGFIDLPGMFRNNNVVSAMPSYFENTESPIVCCRCSRPVRGAVLNVNMLVSDLDLETSSPDSWDCKDSKFCYQPAGHVVAGGLKIITDSRVRSVVSKGPKYRFPAHVDFGGCRETVAGALSDYCARWCVREHVGSGALNNWKLKIFKIVDGRVLFCPGGLDLFPPGPELSSMFETRYPRISWEVCFGSS